MPGSADPELVAAIAGRLAAVRARIEAAGGDPDAITILGVTKGQPAEVCRAALAAGIGKLGENRVQEALAKQAEVEGAEWHLIGHLQTNKVRLVTGRFALIQSLDSLHLAEELGKRGPQPVLLEINVSREPAKHGFAPEEAVQAARRVGELLDLRGVMGMGPLEGDPAPAFAELRRLKEEAEQALGRPLPILSMGMTHDLEVAVRLGSTMLRLGRVLFGERRSA